MKMRLAWILALLPVLAGCSGGVDNDRLRADIISDERGFSVAKFPLNRQSAYLRAATAQGLVTFDREGRIVPALASRWMQADNGRSFIFRLNKARWNNGIEVDADDVAAALNSRIEELRESRFGEALGNVTRVDRMTGRVIQFRLRAPMPNLLEYLAQPEFGVIHNGNGSGPMFARQQGAAMTLRLREEESIDEIILSERRIFANGHRASIALARLQAGDTDIVLDGNFDTLPLLEAADPGSITTDYGMMLGQFGLLLVEAGPFLSEPANLEAIAMGIDRPRMLTAFSGTTWREQISLVQENIEDRGEVARPAWASQNMNDRKMRARAIISGWKAANGNIRPLRFAMPGGPGGRVMFAWLSADLAAIGLDAVRVAPDADADFRLIDRIADSSSAAWFLSQLSCQQTPVCSEEADMLVADARLAATAAQRRILLGEAEAILQQQRNFIPIANPLRWTAYRTGLLGYQGNPRGWHYLQYLGRDPT